MIRVTESQFYDGGMVGRGPTSTRDATLAQTGWMRRLVETILDCPGLISVEAPPGYGKTVLWAVLLTDHGYRPSQKAPFATSTGETEGLPTLVSTDSRGGAAANDHADSSSRTDNVVVFGRSGAHSALDTAVRRIEPSDLRLSESEALEVAGLTGLDESVARAIWVLTSGWPGYFLACVRAIEGSHVTSPAEVRDHLSQGPHLADLVHRCLSGVTAEDRRVVSQLAHFDRCSPPMIRAAMGENAIERLRDSGLPLLNPGAGWLEIAEPVRSVLRSESALSMDLAASLAPVVAAEAGIVAGAKMLIAANHPAAAAKMLASVPAYVIDECSQSELLSTLRTLQYTEKDDGTLAVRLARVLHNRGDLTGQREALERAVSLANDQLRPDLAVEARAELLLLDLVSIDADDALQRLEHLRADARQHSSPTVQTRLREVEAMLAAESGELAAIYRSVDQLRAVAEEWEVSGERARAAATLRLLTATGFLHLGRYLDGMSNMRRATELSASQPQSLAKSVELFARMAALAGDITAFEQAHEEALRLLEGLGLTWAEAYLAWSAMIAAGFCSDTDLVVHNHRKAETALGDLLDHPTGVFFAADSAIAFSMAGDLASATTVLEAAAGRRGESIVEYGIAEITVAARRGRAELVAELVGRLRATTKVPMERDWRIDLEVLIAAAIDSGRVDAARYEQIRAEAARFGLDSLFRAISRTVPLLAGMDNDVFVSLFGQFRVLRDGQEVDVPGGRPTELIKFLAVRGPVPVEVAINHLWADAPTHIATRRLKNVVNRVRTSLGDGSVDRSNSRIGLGSSVRTDLQLFRTLLGGNPSPSAARQALAAYAGPLLELDLYDDWLASERQALKGSALIALNTVVREDDSCSPAWALDTLRRIDPDSEEPYLQVAAIAEQRGDLASLRESWRLAVDACERLGLPPSDALADLRERIRSTL